MIVPQIDPSVAADGNMGVLMALTHAQSTMGNAKVALFLDFVPERGEKLWERFRAFQKSVGEDVGFNHFMTKILTAEPIALFYPKGCTLDKITRGLIVADIQGALMGKLKGDDDMVNIHFGVGEQYQAVRNVACKGCPMTRCQHWVNPHGRRK